MKHEENDYLNQLFGKSSSSDDAIERDFPLVETPAGLNEKLHAIAGSGPVVGEVKSGMFASWPKMASVAATLMVAVIGFQFYQQQQTIQQLEQAQADLATALHYLGEANRITREQVQSSVRENVRAGVEPALEIGRDKVIPNLVEPEIEEPERTRL